jgi:heme-degrading monooxygenase HmoA
MNTCIARVWHGITSEKCALEYLEHIKAKGIPAYRATSGNTGAMVLYRIKTGVAEFYVISFWQSLAAIQRFVGCEDISEAVYYPEDHLYLQFLEPRVNHFHVAGGDMNDTFIKELCLGSS